MYRMLIATSILCAFTPLVNGQYVKSTEVKTLLKTTVSANGKKLVYPKVEQPEVTVSKIVMPKGARTGWHKHNHPLFAYILKGELTVYRKKADPLIYKEGDAVSELVEEFHEGVNEGEEEAILVAFYLGGDGTPLVVMEDKGKDD